MKTDVEEPDMYVPFMGFITYVILYALHSGQIDDFHVDVFGELFLFVGALLGPSLADCS